MLRWRPLRRALTLDDAGDRSRRVRPRRARHQHEIADAQAQRCRRAGAAAARRGSPVPTVATSRGAAPVRGEQQRREPRDVVGFAELRGAAVIARRLDHQHGLPREIRDERVPPVRAPHGRDQYEPRRIAARTCHISWTSASVRCASVCRSPSQIVGRSTPDAAATALPSTMRMSAATSASSRGSSARSSSPGRLRARQARTQRCSATQSRGEQHRTRRGTPPRRRSRARAARRAAAVAARPRAPTRVEPFDERGCGRRPTTAARCGSRPTARPTRRGPPRRSRIARAAACAAAARGSTLRARSSRAPSAASRRARSFLAPLRFGDELAQVLELFAAQLLVLEQLREQRPQVVAEQPAQERFDERLADALALDDRLRRRSCARGSRSRSIAPFCSSRSTIVLTVE